MCLGIIVEEELTNLAVKERLFVLLKLSNSWIFMQQLSAFKGGR